MDTRKRTAREPRATSKGRASAGSPPKRTAAVPQRKAATTPKRTAAVSQRKAATAPKRTAAVPQRKAATAPAKAGAAKEANGALQAEVQVGRAKWTARLVGLSTVLLCRDIPSPQRADEVNSLYYDGVWNGSTISKVKPDAEQMGPREVPPAVLAALAEQFRKAAAARPRKS